MATAGELHPSEGIRLLLVLEAGDRQRAVYEASIYTPTERFEYRATLETGGVASLEPAGEPAPVEHEKKLENLIKSTARAAARKIADNLDPWPARILRWRGPGRG